MADEKVVKVMASALAAQQCARDKAGAIARGIDVNLRPGPYLSQARDDTLAALSALERKGYAVVKQGTRAPILAQSYEHGIEVKDCTSGAGIAHPQEPYRGEKE